MYNLYTESPEISYLVIIKYKDLLHQKHGRQCQGPVLTIRLVVYEKFCILSLCLHHILLNFECVYIGPNSLVMVAISV